MSPDGGGTCRGVSGVDQLQEHCPTNNIIHENHHGSIPGHDCTTAIGQALDASSLAAEDRMMAARTADQQYPGATVNPIKIIPIYKIRFPFP